MEVKQELYHLCTEFVNKRLQTIEQTIQSNQKALTSETKSSAGDKHETGRAMLQLEMEKAGQQLQNIRLMKETLAKLDLSTHEKVARLGSLVVTDKTTFFLSISAGKLTANSKDFFAVSVSSPIGRMLLGKQENDSFIFNQHPIKIKKVF